jgi:hypothetical protein
MRIRTSTYSDAEVVAALSAYGATLKKGKTAKAVEDRLDLLSGLLWSR